MLQFPLQIGNFHFPERYVVNPVGMARRRHRINPKRTVQAIEIMVSDVSKLGS